MPELDVIQTKHPSLDPIEHKKKKSVSFIAQKYISFTMDTCSTYNSEGTPVKRTRHHNWQLSTNNLCLNLPQHRT